MQNIRSYSLWGINNYSDYLELALFSSVKTSCSYRELAFSFFEQKTLWCVAISSLKAKNNNIVMNKQKSMDHA